MDMINIRLKTQRSSASSRRVDGVNITLLLEAEILTQDESLADKIAVDKITGCMRSIY
jgi:hypothetical protein